MGPFRIIIEKKTSRLDYDSLPDHEKEILFNGIRYDAQRHRIFRLRVMVAKISTRNMNRRTIRQRSYERATHALIWLRNANPEKRFLGIYPVMLSAAGEPVKQMEGEAILELSAPPFARLQIRGKYQSAQRKFAYKIQSACTGESAQWIFSKPYLEENLGFSLDFICDNNWEKVEENFIWCTVRFEEKGREIRSLNKKILLA